MNTQSYKTYIDSQGISTKVKIYNNENHTMLAIASIYAELQNEERTLQILCYVMLCYVSFIIYVFLFNYLFEFDWFDVGLFMMFEFVVEWMGRGF